MGKNILKFPEEGLKQLQFFMEGLSFPVAVAAYSEQDIGKLSYLIRLLQRGDIRSTYARRDLCVATKTNYVEILNFRHFFKHIVFTSEGDKIRNKEIKTISVFQ